MKKRILSILLCLCMVCMLLPTTALATDFGHNGHTCGESCTHHAKDPHRTVRTENWEAWTDALAASQNGSEKTASNSLPSAAGNYYLTENVTLTGTWTPEDGVVLCLNGKTITGADRQEVIQVNRGVTFTLTDCHTGNEVGQITHKTGASGCGVYVQYGTFNMYGGSITGNTVGGNGGGVCATNNSTFNMYGGSITGNTVGGSGGGVYLDGSFTVSGNVNITGNHKSGDANENNVYLYNNKTITIGTGGLAADAKIGVTTYTTPLNSAPVTIVSSGAKAGYGEYFTSDKEGCYPVYQGGKIVLYAGAPHQHPICGATCGHDSEVWQAIGSANELRKATDGSYYLTNDIRFTDNTWTPANGMKLCLNGHSITGADGYAVITINKRFTFTLTDCKTGDKQGKITHEGDKTGHGVYVKGTFNMYGGTITGNKDDSGGGVYVYSSSDDNSTFNMYGGSITGNTANVNGGGVYVDTAGRFNMSGGSIGGTGNDANTANLNGGGVYVDGPFNMSGSAAITGNEASDNGGGVYVTGSGTLEMFDSAGISGNNAIGSYGGGVYVYNGTFTMKDSASITGNKASDNGGGVYVTGDSGTLEMFDSASITGNNAIGIFGGGVYVGENAAFTVSGAVNITGNTAKDGKVNNVFLPFGDQGLKSFTIGTGGLTAGAEIGVATDVVPNNPGYYLTVATLSEGATYTEGIITSDRTGDYVIKAVGNNINLYNGLPHVHAICGKTCTHTGSDVQHTDVIWTPLTSANGTPYAGSTALGTDKFNTTVGYVLPARGHYYLSTELTLDKPLLIKKGVSLCLNGQTLRVSSDNSAIIIDTNCDLTLCDCSEEQRGTITHAASATGRGVYMGASTDTANNYNGSFTMYSGSISGNRLQTGNGSGVYMQGKGTFNMHGGSITDNTAEGESANGSGVHVTGGTFNMTGGSITGNGGGVRVNGSGRFNMSGNAAITGNIVSGNGGGVYVYAATFIMSGNASVSGNTASYGGGVYVGAGTAPTAAKFTMNGNASVSGNSAKYGGGVYMDDHSGFTMSSNAAITGNNVNSDGGGVYVKGYTATMTVSGDVQIKDNWQDGSKNDKTGVYEKGDDSSANNFYLFGEDETKQQTITIGGVLETTARIGVTTCLTPTAEKPIQIATGATGDLSYTTIFTPDVKNKGYVVTKDESGTLSLTAHQHSWRYTADKATITATCEDCPLATGGSNTYSGSITVKAPAVSEGQTLTYDGSAKAATVDTVGGLTAPSITYKQGGAELNGAPTNAGTYIASITVGTEESAVTASVEYEIKKAPLTVTAKPKTITYGDAPANDGVTYSGFVNDENENALGGELAYTYGYARYGNVGDYTIVPSGLTSNNYAIRFVNGTLTVAQREVTLTWDNTDGRTAGDGKRVTATAENLVNGDTVSVTVTGGDATTAGTYTATATGLDGGKAGNYKLPEANTKDYTIGLAAQTLRFETFGSVSKTYGDANFTNAATGNHGTVTYSSDNTGVATVNSSTGEVTIKGAGTATITANAAAVDGKYSAGSASYTLTISPATVTVTAGEYQVSKVYDGGTSVNTATITGTLGVTGILSVDSAVKVKATPVPYTNPNVGGQTSMNVSIALTGAKAGNYQLASSTVSVPCEITKRSITISDATVSSKDYDGNENATVTAVTFDGAIETLEKGTDFTVTSATFPDADADNAKVNVTINVALENTTKANNYTLTNGTNYVASSAAKITPLDITTGATVGSFNDMTYDGNPKTPKATVTKNGLTVTGTWSAVTNVSDKTTFTASGNFTGTIADKTTGMAKKTVDALTLTSLVTAPVKNGMPQTSISQTQYTGGISWSSSPVKFLGNTVYTATLTLTATANYTFTGVTTNSFTYSGATTVANEADSGTVTITFPATLNAEVTGIAIKTAATKTAYKVGDALDVTGLTITATMDDSTTPVVQVTTDMVSGFNSSAVTASQTLTITYGEKTTTYTISVAKADQTIDAANVNAVYGDTGKSVVATNTTVADGVKIPGALSYAVTAGNDVVSVDPDGALTILKAGTATVTVTAAETGTCAQATKDVTVTVNKKPITAPTADTTVFTYNGTEQTYTLEENAAYTVTNNKRINAGTQNVTVALRDKDNTKWAGDGDDTADKPYTFIIKKATITVTAQNQSIYVGEAAPTLDAGSYTVTGLVNGETLVTLPTAVYASEPNTAVAGTVTINVSGAAAPAGGNYNDIVYVPGTLTISARPYSGSSYNPPTYKVESEVTESTDGNVSFSKGSAKKGDTVTITVTPDRYYKVDSVTVKDKNGNEIDVIDNGDGTFSFKMPASKVTVEPVFSWDNPFTDVAEDTYYTPAVEWALKNDVTNGTGDDTTFGPDAECTRAQIVTFLWRAAGCPEPAGLSSFADVSADAYYAKAVAWAVEQGITNGTGDGTTFSPDATCTRSQGVTFLYRSAGSPEVSDDIAFNDVTTGSYYSDAVVWATQNGVTDGTGNSKFSPVRDCTRAQIVTFLYRWMVK